MVRTIRWVLIIVALVLVGVSVHQEIGLRKAARVMGHFIKQIDETEKQYNDGLATLGIPNDGSAEPPFYLEEMKRMVVGDSGSFEEAHNVYVSAVEEVSAKTRTLEGFLLILAVASAGLSFILRRFDPILRMVELYE